MIQLLWNYIRGYLIIEIVGNSPERFVNMCAHHNIKLWDFSITGNVFRFNIALKNTNDLEVFSKKTGIDFRIASKVGLPFISKKLKNRPIFLPGLLLSFILIYVYTLFVWDISVTGNTQYSEEEIVKFLNQNNIYKTMLKSSVDTSNTTFMMRSHFNDVIWVSVHLEGSSLMIKVKENQNKDEQESVTSTTKENGLEGINAISTPLGYDMVAQSDGVISSIITRVGVPLVHKGDVVKKGDILVSGRIELIDDYGEIIGYNYVKSDADVLIERTSEYIERISTVVYTKNYAKFSIYDMYFKIGDYYIEFGTHINNDFLWDYQIKEYQFHPSKQEKFNLVIGVQKIQKYELIEEKLLENEIRTTLSNKFNEYISEIQEKGVEIIENNVTIVIDNNEAIASGVLIEEVKNTYLIATEVLQIETGLENLEE